MKVLVLTDKENIDITNLINNVKLSTSMETVGASLTFDVARNYNDLEFTTCENIKIGDVVILEAEEQTVFKGTILEQTFSKFSKSVKCLDFCFYLNKNKILKQFEEISASDAIKQLLKEAGAPLGEVSSMSTSISKMYNNNTVAEIIADILNQVNNETGIKYVLEYENDVFNILPFKVVEVNFTSDKTADESVTESILEMKNKIIVISNEQDEAEILATAQDDNNIEKYGSLQEIISVEPDEDEAKVRNIAKIKLKELNKVFKTASLQGFGNVALKSGRVLKLSNKEFYLNGGFLIKSCVHTWKNGEHITNVEVEEYAE